MAAATVCAEYAGLALGLFLARRSLRTIAGDWRWAVIKRAAAFKRPVAVNCDIMLRSLSLERSNGFVVVSPILGEKAESVRDSALAD